MKHLSALSLFCYSVLTASLMVGCNGSGSGPQHGSVEIPSIASMDGHVRSNGFVSTSGTMLLTGDCDQIFNGVGFRQFYSFDISSIPKDIDIINATLYLYMANVSQSPFSNHGNVTVDHLDYGSSLDATDYDTGAIQSDIGVLANNYILEYKALDVTSSVQNDYSFMRTHSQYRIRFSIQDSDSDSETECVSFNDAEDSFSLNKPPKLIVQY